LGYEEGSSSGQPSNKHSIKFVKSTTNDNNKPAETKEDNKPPRRSKEKCPGTKYVEQRNNAPSPQGNHQHGINQPAQRIHPFSRYKDFFYGNCFYCSNFGHKTVNCSLRFIHEKSRFPRNKCLPQQRMRQPSNKQPHIANGQINFRDMKLRRSRNNEQPMNRQRYKNHFDLLNNELESYGCHNFNHKAANCHIKNYKTNPRINLLARNASTWKNKDSGKCGLALSTKKQKASGNIDSGCSKHMNGEKDKLMPISKIKTGNEIIENDEPGRIKDKGMVSLINGKEDAQDVLPEDGLKHNFLNLSQMCDRGCKEVVNSKDCKIKSVNSVQVVAKCIRTDSNVDIESSPTSKKGRFRYNKRMFS
jgi:hypothetical protein